MSNIWWAIALPSRSMAIREAGLLHNSIRKLQRDSIASVSLNGGWERLQSYGYQCIKVRVTPITNGSSVNR